MTVPKGQQDHCGTPYNKQRGPISVYNLEVYKRHTYRIGSEGVVVHNGCDQDASIPFNIGTRRFQYHPVATRDPVTLDEDLDIHDPEVMRLVTVNDAGRRHVEGYYHRSSITSLQDNLSPTSRRLIVGFLHSNGNIEEILPNPEKLSMMDRWRRSGIRLTSEETSRYVAEYIEEQIQTGERLWLSLQPGALEVIVHDPVSLENFLYIGGSRRGEMVFADIMNLENTFVWLTGDQAFQPYRP